MDKNKLTVNDILYFEVAIDEFYDSIDIFELVNKFVPLQRYDDHIFRTDICSGEHIISVNKKSNECYIDNELKNVTEIIAFFDDTIEPISYIEKLYFKNINDYISGIYFKNGTQIFLNVNNANKFKGSSLFLDPFDIGEDEINRILKRKVNIYEN